MIISPTPEKQVAEIILILEEEIKIIKAQARREAMAKIKELLGIIKQSKLHA